MARHQKVNKKERFEPKIGFEGSVEGGMSFSFSEFDIPGNAQKSNSFFSESEKGADLEEQSESQQSVNVSNGLNHAFFEENSDSPSINTPVKLVKEFNEKTEIENHERKKVSKERSEDSEGPEIILANTESPLKVEKKIEKIQEPPRVDNSRKKKTCCKCGSCCII